MAKTTLALIEAVVFYRNGVTNRADRELLADVANELSTLNALKGELAGALQELAAVVRGECPSLLDEDSGGSAKLSIEIDAAIAKAEGRS